MGDFGEIDLLRAKLTRGIQDVFTPKERRLLGETGESDPEAEGDWDIPIAIRNKELTVEEAQIVRRDMVGFNSLLVKGHLLDKIDPLVDVVVSLEDLGLITKRTISDPKIGVIKESDKGKVFVENPQWTTVVRNAENFHWRPIENGSPPESKGQLL